jgi:hypothetical protein
MGSVAAHVMLGVLSVLGIFLAAVGGAVLMVWWPLPAPTRMPWSRHRTRADGTRLTRTAGQP